MARTEMHGTFDIRNQHTLARCMIATLVVFALACLCRVQSDVAFQQLGHAEQAGGEDARREHHASGETVGGRDANSTDGVTLASSMKLEAPRPGDVPVLIVPTTEGFFAQKNSLVSAGRAVPLCLIVHPLLFHHTPPYSHP
jgi:hypothetical protein